MSDHFQGKTALRHLSEVRAQGVAVALEIHGAEIPGPLFAFLDAARMATMVLLFMLISLEFYHISFFESWPGLAASMAGLIFWLGARSTLLAWCRLNRLHTIALEEKNEIDTNRSQEREELAALYGLKGFSGPLLDKVVEVLMADKDRLLKVMLQEEMGFKLEEHPHPLVQGISAAFGATLSFVFILFAFLGMPHNLLVSVMISFVALLGMLFAKFERNLLIPSFIWNASIVSVVVVIVRMFLQLFSHR